MGTTPQTVNHGADGTLVTATPNAGYHFVSWSDGYATAARTDLGVTANVNATATFAVNTYTITLAAGANGSINPNTPQSVNGGDNFLFTVTANAGYHISSVLEDGSTELGTSGSYTLTSVNANHSIVASFAKNSIVVSQVYGGGGNTGATLTNDFIELFNRGGDPINVTGWTVQYAPATGTSWATTALSGTILPGHYYLVQEATGAGGTTALPTPDASGGIAMNSTTGKVALVSGNTALTGACPTGGTIEDMVGYAPSANCSETTPAPTLSNTTANLRLSGGCQDTDNNAADFATGAPTPRNSASPANNCQLTLAVSVDPPGSGSVNLSPLQASYANGALVVLTATGVSGYHFSHWTGGLTGGANPATVTMTSNKTIVAHFQSNTLASEMVISQVYGGGGNAGATYKNDYVEIYNRGNDAQDVTGWTVQYASNAGGPWASTVLIGTVLPGQYYLVQESQGTGGTTDLPAPDAIGSTGVSATDGKVALVRSNVLLVGDCPSDPSIVDLLGYGPANCFETAPAPLASNTLASFRGHGGCDETNDNSADFANGAPGPRNTASPFNHCSMWLGVGKGAVTEFSLSSPAPNPTRGASRIPFALPVEAHVRLSVVDVQGRMITRLVDGVLPAGRHEVMWDGSSAAGSVRPGIYFIRLEVPGQRMVRTVVLMR